jgi:hypothetical protein
MNMSDGFLILLMVFCHIVDDYYLQGILAKMKQKKWWEENAPDKKYKTDWEVALYMHGFSWTFMIMLPIAIANQFEINLWFVIIFFVNMSIHCFVDDLKANKLKINLRQDQGIHLLQILVTAWLHIFNLI